MKTVSSLVIIYFLGATKSFAAPTGSADLNFESNVATGHRLIQTSNGQSPFWVTEDEKLNLLKKGADFFDLTETYHREQLVKSTGAQAKLKITCEYGQVVLQHGESTELLSDPAPSHQAEIKALLPSLSITNMESYLSNLTSFQNRYYKSEHGLAASNYIYDTLSRFSQGKAGVSVTKVSHSFVQQSIIAQITGTSNESSIVILGAHEDSIIPEERMTGRAPGADDNGTGVMNVIEVFRVLVESGFKPTRTVEFHLYAGEEEGLFGSQDIALNYKSAGRGVYGMLNLDMTGYFKPGTNESIALVTDYTDLGLTKYCGYACSDHASWNRNGFPAACPFEAPNGNSNENLHTTQDTTSIDGFSFEHSLEFAKLALAFVYELGV